MRTQQSGVALITAMLVVALATVLATSLVSQVFMDTRRTQNIINNEQAYLYAVSAEKIAGNVLIDDQKKSKYDSLDELWAAQTPPFPVDGGQVMVNMVDLQSRFNLNNLSKTLNKSGYKKEIIRFKKLLRILEIRESTADALVDWLDEDIETTIPGGAEDDFYISMLPPYRAANTLMSSVSELRLIKGFNEKLSDTETVYDRIQGFVCVLPVVTMININTAPMEMLISSSTDITALDTDSIIKYRGVSILEPGTPFETVKDFKKYMESTLKKKKFITTGMAISTDYFLLQTYAQIGRGHSRLFSVINRQGNGVLKTISRSQGVW